MNSVLELLEARCSTRAYDQRHISAEDRAAILHGAMRAPTAGNMMLYSIIDVTDQAMKERLAVTCDNQPFIAKAPLVLVFVADYQKWVDLFVHSGVDRVQDVEHRTTPGMGDLLLACSDALIAAQNAVIAAESLGIGSCYIGDILEQAETHAEMLDLPPHTLPVTMLCFGYPVADKAPVPRYEKHVVHENAYKRLTPEELTEVSDDLARMYAPHGFKPGIENYGQAVYQRKYTSEFTKEMNRSVERWLERWSSTSR